MGMLRGLPAALSASVALVAAAGATLVTLAAIIGFRAWSGGDAGTERATRLQVATPGPRVRAAFAPAVATPTRASTPLRGAAGRRRTAARRATPRRARRVVSRRPAASEVPAPTARTPAP